MDDVPLDVLFANVCAFVHLHDRWFRLARVSKRWRKLALASAHSEQHIDLTWCSGEHELNVAATILAHSRPHVAATKLTALTLFGPRVTATLLRDLFSAIGATQLTQLELESKQIADAALSELTGCSALQTLTLHCIKLTDAALQRISRACPLLARVDISGCSRICDDGVLALASNCAGLTLLNASMCHRITDRAVLALGLRQAKTLQVVVLDKCLKISGIALRFLLQLQPNLRSLSFANCPKVHGADLYALDNGHKQATLPYCRLTELDMRDCAALDSASVVALVMHNTSTLQKLSVSALLGSTSTTFHAIAQCTQLRELDVSLCRSLTDSDVVELTRGCCKLQTLLLQGCVNITDAALVAIAQHSTQLECLSLEFCYNVTDAGFSQIVAQCQRLARLNVKACNQLTTTAFKNLVRDKLTAHPLKTLELGACAGQLTTTAYATIVKQKFPRCVVHTA